MITNHRLWAFFCLFCCLFFAGCSGPWKATKKIGQVLLDPDIPVGKTSNQPSKLMLTLFAEPNINRNENGEATPLEIQIIALKEDSRLLALDYDQLGEQKLNELLGKNYIDHQDFTLLPGQYKPLPLCELEKNQRYIGVIAHYRFPELSEWKKVVRVDDIGQTYHMLVNLRSAEVVLKKQKEDE